MIRQRIILWFFIAAILLLFLSAYVDFKEKIIRLAQLQQTEKKLSKELQAKDQPLDKKNIMANSTSLIDLSPGPNSLKVTEVLLKLIRAIEDNNYTVQTLQPLSIQTIAGMPVLPIKILVQGSLRQLSRMLMSFMSHFRMGVSDFSLQVDEQGMAVLEMSVLIVCLPSTNTVSLEQEKQINTASLEQIKYVGYMQNDQHFWALIMLPNGKTLAITVGSAIGAKNWHVLKVSAEKIIVAMGSQQFIIHNQTALYSGNARARVATSPISVASGF